MASMDVDLGFKRRVALYESSGRPARATICSRWPVGEASLTNLLEEEGHVRSHATLDVPFEPYEIATIRALLQSTVAEEGARTDLAPRQERAQPVFADYWLHNKGAAPMGYQAVTVQIRPSAVSADGRFTVPIVVSSERTDEAVAGRCA